MNEVFADTFFWTALANPRDTAHGLVIAVRQSLDDATLVTTDEVLVELAANLAGAERQMRVFVSEYIARILTDPRIDVVPQSRDTFLRGLELYRSRPDKSYSLTDCVSMQTMKSRRIQKVLTQDRHFEQEGFRALL
jgi:predicted nucleic acid-binding protein